jgi:hypothetical protein
MVETVVQQSQSCDAMNETRNMLRLSDADIETLIKLDKKWQIVREAVGSVAMRLNAGYVLYGRGGIGKTHVVVDELIARNTSYRVCNSHLTPRALFDVLESHPDEIHIFDDVEEILNNKTSLGILRSAMWESGHGSSGERTRLITWSANRVNLRCHFTGGIIVISNSRLGISQEIKALLTRISIHEISVSHQEIASMIRRVALDGYRIDNWHLDPAECVEIAEFIIEKSAHDGGELDMRLFVLACKSRIQANSGQSGRPWRETVSSLINRRPTPSSTRLGIIGVREQNRKQHIAIANEIRDMPPEERLSTWEERTGRSQTTLYRCMRRLPTDSQPDGLSL